MSDSSFDSSTSKEKQIQPMHSSKFLKWSEVFSQFKLTFIRFLKIFLIVKQCRQSKHSSGSIFKVRQRLSRSVLDRLQQSTEIEFFYF